MAAFVAFLLTAGPGSTKAAVLGPANASTEVAQHDEVAGEDAEPEESSADPQGSGGPGKGEEPPPPATVGGVAGTAVAADEGGKAQAQLEGTGAAPSDAPERMAPLEAAGWWTLFGAAGLATTAGVLAGLAEAQEDRMLRLANEFDADTGMQPRYEDRQDAYETALRRGRRLQWAAWGLLAASGTALAASIGLLIAHARTHATEQRRARVGLHGLEVRF